MKRFVLFAIAGMLVGTLGFSTARVLAADETFYSGNNILFYNEDARECTSTEIAASGDNAGNIFNFLLAKGLNDLQSAAVVGNLMQESSLQPNALNKSSGAYGIAQWLGGRKDALLEKSFYHESDPDPSLELQVQLDYLWEELQGSESGSYTALTTATTTDPGELAVIFGEAFERYGPDEEGKRAEYATKYYEEFKGSVASDGECGVPAGDFKYYSQLDDEWGSVSYGTSTIRIAGCGPTSLAMIVATLVDGSVTPDEMAKLGESNGSFIEGVGTAHIPLLDAAVSKYGINYQDMSGQPVSRLINTVLEGGLVYIAGQGAAPFTEGGHVVVMRGVTDDGKIIIADPARNGADVYDQATIDAGMNIAFAITK